MVLVLHRRSDGRPGNTAAVIRWKRKILTTAGGRHFSREKKFSFSPKKRKEEKTIYSYSLAFYQPTTFIVGVQSSMNLMVFIEITSQSIPATYCNATQTDVCYESIIVLCDHIFRKRTKAPKRHTYPAVIYHACTRELKSTVWLY